MGEYEPRDSRQVTGMVPKDQSVNAAGRRKGETGQQGQMDQQGASAQQPGIGQQLGQDQQSGWQSETGLQTGRASIDQPQQGQFDRSQLDQSQMGQSPSGSQGGQQQQFQQGAGQMNESSGQGQAGQLGGSSGMAGQAAGGVRGQLREHMEIIGADGVHVGTIDAIEGDRIKLTKSDSGMGSHQGHHHYLPLGLVAGIEGDRVRLSANGDVASRFVEEE